ncbi:MAG: ribbon-helix-helix domain-containing protein [archaeon]
MKTKISISVEEKTNNQIEAILDDGFFRSKSHVIEYAVKKFIKSQNEPT